LSFGKDPNKPRYYSYIAGRPAVYFILLALLVCAPCATVWYSPAYYCRADSRGSLLVAQALLEKGTTRLDTYRDEVSGLGYRLISQDGHLHYYFPLGTSLFAVPGVGVARMFGLDMVREQDDIRLQKILAGFLLAAATVLIYALGRLYVGRLASVLVAVAYGACTSLTSTLGSALWSHDLAIVFVLLGLYVLMKIRATESGGGPLAAALGIIVVAAWLCRPTAALFGVTAAAYLAWVRPRLLIPFAAAVMAVGGCFVGWSWHDIHQVLPSYYLPARLGGTTHFAQALMGHVVSPGRGLFVYSPVLLVTLWGVVRYGRSLRRDPAVVVLVVWFVGFWLSLSRFPHWWGGYCYGSRLMSDILPAWILLTILLWRHACGRMSSSGLRIVVAVWALAALWGFYVNNVKGLHDEATLLWNGRPDIDTHPGLIFDWRSPQFLATKAGLERREIPYRLAAAAPYRIDTAIDLDGANAVLSGFNGIEPDGDARFRWTEGTTARVYFATEPADPVAGPLVMFVRCAYFGEQRVTVRLNGVELGELQGRDFPPTESTLVVPATAWARGLRDGRHVIEFRIPGARRAGGTDLRVLGAALYTIQFNHAA
jgi:hypothetical protein